MLDYSPENLWEECQAAEKHNLKHLFGFNDIIQTFVGSFYRDDMMPVNAAPENYPYSYVANVKPRLVFNNPRFNCTSESSSIDSNLLIMQAKFVNRWTVKENLQKILSPFVTTALLMRSVILTTFEDDPDDAELPPSEMKRKMPRCHLLENHRYFRDPVSTPATPPRYKGHTWVRDLEDVKKMKGVNKDALEKLCPDVDLSGLKRPNDQPGSDNAQPPRFEIVAYEIWVPECNDYATDRGHNGTIFTIASGQAVQGGRTTRTPGQAYLFEPRPYYGPPWGPYTELEFVDVPGQTYGTSPVCVVMQQIEEVNAHRAATADAAARMKHLVFVDAANDTLQLALQQSPDGTILGIPNLTKDQVQQVLVGGVAPEQYQYNEYSTERLDQTMGMGATERGGTASDDRTATASNIRYETLNVRMDDLKNITAQAVKQIANTVSWYGWESNNVTMLLGGADGEDLGMEGPLAYLGGPQQGQQLPPWDAAALELEPYSMEAIDEDKLSQQVMEALALITQMAQEMQAAPWLGFDVILEQLGKLRKFDWISECINTKLFAAYMQQQQSQTEQTHAGLMAEQQLKLAGMDLDNKLKQADVMMRMRELMTPDQGREDKPPSISINYADLPEDDKRAVEVKAGLPASQMPLTTPEHIGNAVDLHKTAAGMQQDRQMQQGAQQHDSRKMAATQRHDSRKLAATQRHDTQKQQSDQKYQRKQSELSNMFKAMGQGSARGSMKGRGNRAQNGPTKTARKGQRAYAESA